jgi:hypothetical protein
LTTKVCLTSRLQAHGLSLEIYVRLSKITDALYATEDFPSGFERYRLLASRQEKDYHPGCYVCLDEFAGGSVVAIHVHYFDEEGNRLYRLTDEWPVDHPTSKPNVYFYNSSIRQFAECRLVFQEVRQTLLQDVNWEENFNEVTRAFQATLEREFRRIDPIAMEDGPAVWLDFIALYFV